VTLLPLVRMLTITPSTDILAAILRCTIVRITMLIGLHES
jgi:hypothetical protein